MSNNILNWYGWIPTNKGKISFEFINVPDFLQNKNSKIDRKNDSIKIENIDVSYLSDSYIFRNFINKSKIKQTEQTATANLNFKKSENNIQGNIEICYKDFTDIKANFNIKSNGEIEFKEFEIEIVIENDILVEIKKLLYVLVKTIVHGDAHHHQKIDIALPIIDKEFKAEVVSESLLDYIKLAEKNTKNTKNCNSLFRNENIVYEIDGYLAYFKSFTLLFENEKIKKDFEFATSVVSSLKSTVQKRRNKTDFYNGLYTAFFTFLGILISINILLNGFWKIEQNDIVEFLSDISRMNTFYISLVFVLVLFFSYTKCKLQSLIYYKYYEIFEVLKFIKHSSYSDLSILGKIIKFSPILLFNMISPFAVTVPDEHDFLCEIVFDMVAFSDFVGKSLIYFS